MSAVDQKCRAWLVEQGYRVEKVERWNAFTKRKHDLYGFIDYLAVGNGETVGVQATSYNGNGNFAARLRKTKEAEALEDLLKAGWIIKVAGFKKGTKAPVRVETLRF